MALEAEDIAGLDDGIRELVVWLDGHLFDTTDSGDGTKAPDQEGALPYPMVAMSTDVEGLVLDANRLHGLLLEAGVDFKIPRRFDVLEVYPSIEASYNPEDDSCVLLLTGILSADIKNFV